MKRQHKMHKSTEWMGIFVIGSMIFLMARLAPSPAMTEAQPKPLDILTYRNVAVKYARRHGLEPSVFLAQIGQESGYNPQAVSSAGARGIAQIMPSTARAWRVNPDDPEQALDAAADHMARYVRTYRGDYAKALAAYNAGPNAVARYGGVPPYPETRSYIRRILGRIRNTFRKS